MSTAPILSGFGPQLTGQTLKSAATTIRSSSSTKNTYRGGSGHPHQSRSRTSHRSFPTSATSCVWSPKRPTIGCTSTACLSASDGTRQVTTRRRRLQKRNKKRKSSQKLCPKPAIGSLRANCSPSIVSNPRYGRPANSVLTRPIVPRPILCFYPLILHSRDDRYRSEHCVDRPLLVEPA